MDFFFYILAGAGVGLAVGMTGVGGGSLMTPLLILAGVPERIAIGTDLLYAAATKTGAMASHSRRGHINWRIVTLLAAGSLPASVATSLIFKLLVPDDYDYSEILTQSLGIMLILTAIVVFYRNALIAQNGNSKHVNNNENIKSARTDIITVISGIALGIFVTLSSVGAGAFCAALLLFLYPRLPAINVVGTDIAHAVPLTLVAGLGHLWNQNVDFALLAGLLAGSLPAVHLGTKFASKVPNRILQPILASLLLIIGCKFLFS